MLNHARTHMKKILIFEKKNPFSNNSLAGLDYFILVLLTVSYIIRAFNGRDN